MYVVCIVKVCRYLNVRWVNGLLEVHLLCCAFEWDIHRWRTSLYLHTMNISNSLSGSYKLNFPLLVIIKLIIKCDTIKPFWMSPVKFQLGLFTFIEGLSNKKKMYKLFASYPRNPHELNNYILVNIFEKFKL